MRTEFNEHLPLSNDHILRIWNDCIFIFDTNVLLNFYRYSTETCKELEEIIRFYDGRIWIPYHVGTEFFSERLNVISEQVRNYNEPTKDLKRIINLLSSKKGHPFISELILKDFVNITEKITDEFERQQSLLSNLIQNDSIANTIADIFDKKVGEPYSEDDLTKIYQEGKERYNNNIPPGFKDINKPEPNRYGDLIIWKQLIDKSKSEEKPVVFITDDEKEDWILHNSGKNLGALPYLTKEFKNTSGQDIIIYPTAKFLKQSYHFKQIEVKQIVIDEIKSINKFNNIEITNNNNTYYMINFVTRFQKSSAADIDKFYSLIEEQGYSLHISKISDLENFISLEVPFKDLIRRFNNRLLTLAQRFNIEILSFKSFSSFS